MPREPRPPKKKKTAEELRNQWRAAAQQLSGLEGSMTRDMTAGFEGPRMYTAPRSAEAEINAKGLDTFSKFMYGVEMQSGKRGFEEAYERMPPLMRTVAFMAPSEMMPEETPMWKRLLVDVGTGVIGGGLLLGGGRKILQQNARWEAQDLGRHLKPGGIFPGPKKQPQVGEALIDIFKRLGPRRRETAAALEDMSDRLYARKNMMDMGYNLEQADALLDAYDHGLISDMRMDAVLSTDDTGRMIFDYSHLPASELLDQAIDIPSAADAAWLRTRRILNKHLEPADWNEIDVVRDENKTFGELFDTIERNLNDFADKAEDINLRYGGESAADLEALYRKFPSLRPDDIPDELDEFLASINQGDIQPLPAREDKKLVDEFLKSLDEIPPDSPPYPMHPDEPLQGDIPGISRSVYEPEYPGAPRQFDDPTNPGSRPPPLNDADYFSDMSSKELEELLEKTPLDRPDQVDDIERELYRRGLEEDGLEFDEQAYDEYLENLMESRYEEGLRADQARIEAEYGGLSMEELFAKMDDPATPSREVDDMAREFSSRVFDRELELRDLKNFAEDVKGWFRANPDLPKTPDTIREALRNLGDFGDELPFNNVDIQMILDWVSLGRFKSRDMLDNWLRVHGSFSRDWFSRENPLQSLIRSLQNEEISFAEFTRRLPEGTRPEDLDAATVEEFLRTFNRTPRPATPNERRELSRLVREGENEIPDLFTIERLLQNLPGGSREIDLPQLPYGPTSLQNLRDRNLLRDEEYYESLWEWMNMLDNPDLH